MDRRLLVNPSSGISYFIRFSGFGYCRSFCSRSFCSCNTAWFSDFTNASANFLDSGVEFAAEEPFVEVPIDTTFFVCFFEFFISWCPGVSVLYSRHRQISYLPINRYRIDELYQHRPALKALLDVVLLVPAQVSS